MRRTLTEYRFRSIDLAPHGTDRPDWNGKVLSHVAIHDSLNANAGDTLLPQSVRRTFDAVTGPYGWELRQVWEPFTRGDVEHFNGSVDGLVVGGGGFFIRDQAGSNTANSGWLWNIPHELLRALRKPVVLFAVGYNRFRRQEDFDEHFARHLALTLEKCAFAGIRNTGSIERLREYLPSEELKARLTLQYCPTTVSWQVFPEESALAAARDLDAGRQQTIAFNFAFDRPVMRFGEKVEQRMDQIAMAAGRLAERGWRIVVTCHKSIDRAIEAFLEKHAVEYDTHDLTNADHREILRFYAGIDLAVGMRGHSQLIPFGLRRKIVSIVSHDKMRYFLEDIGHPEWGVEVEADDFPDRLVEVADSVGRSEAAAAQVAEAQESVWALTRSNVESIHAALGERGAR